MSPHVNESSALSRCPAVGASLVDTSVPVSGAAWRRCLRHAFDELGGRTTGLALQVQPQVCGLNCAHPHCSASSGDGPAPGYTSALLGELALLSRLLGAPLRVREVYLGGAPGPFDGAALECLAPALLRSVRLGDGHRLSFEAGAASITRRQLQRLHQLGFRHLNLAAHGLDTGGVPLRALLGGTVRTARELGFDSIGLHYVYGQPRRGLAEMVEAIEQIATLRPQRVALHGYHTSAVACGVAQPAPPRSEEHLALHAIGHDLLLEAGYQPLGMEHFCLPGDELGEAARRGTLHRHRFGYSARPTALTLGIGVGAVSDAYYGVVRNETDVHSYLQRVTGDELPVGSGHLLDAGELRLRRCMDDLACRYRTRLQVGRRRGRSALGRLRQMQAEGLIELDGDELRVTLAGRPHLRSVWLAVGAALA